MALFTILALLIGLYAAFHFSDKFSRFISTQTDSMPEYLPAFSFLILFLLVGACIYFGGKALEQVIKIAQLSLVNKLLGAVLGLIKWAYIIGVLLENKLFEKISKEMHNIYDLPKIIRKMELNKVYPGGVALPGAVNSGGVTKKEPKYDKTLYNANKKSDRDKDGIACEK